MIRLIEQIEQYASARRGAEFRVFVQNGESIVLDDHDQPDELTTRYGAAVDGVGFEGLFYDGARRIPASRTQARLDSLGPMYASRAWCAAIGCGPQFFAIDHVLRGENLNSPANRRRAARMHDVAIARGLIPYAARLDRRLDEVVELGGPRWAITQPDDRCGLSCPVCLAGLDIAGALAVAGPAQAVPAPDGVVNQHDADHFFFAFDHGNMDADLTGSAVAGQPGYGVPDGVLDQSDVAYFLEWYARR
jgi:hypothetical protein